MAEPHSSSVPKTRVYDLLYRLNSAFTRVIKNVALLDDIGVFDAETITHIQTRSEELRADVNHRLLGKLHNIEQQDCTRFAQTD